MTQTPASQIKPSIKSEIARLVGLRTAWEQALLLTNRQQYNLLADIAGLAKSYSRDELVTLATSSGFKPAKNTSDVLIAMKLVFGFETDEERKKASAYAKAVENGIAAGQTPATIANWLSGVGGVEAARKKTQPASTTPLATPAEGSATTQSPAQPLVNSAPSISSDVIVENEAKAIDRANDFLANAYSALTLDKGFFPEELPFVESGYCAVLMCPNDEGNYQQLFASSRTEAVNPMLRALGRALDAEANPHDALTSRIIAKVKDAPDESELDALIDQAANA
ncbi:MAG: hypothetical protein J7562_12675 [Agrobacterium tumefaciens]|nr:hypothetical protein [Agrobacterium tumefaciens]